MNKKQLLVLWVTIGFVVLLSIFPVRKAGSYSGRGFFFNREID